MKKLYIMLACAAMALGSNAQNVKFYYDGKVIETGSTIKFNEAENDGFEYLFKPNIILKADANQTVKVIVECTTGQNVNLCFGGTCGQASTTVTSPTTNLYTGQEYPLQYDYVSYDPIDYVVSSDVSVIDDITEAVVNKITVVFDPSSNSVSLVDTKSAFSYSNGTIRFNTDKAESLTIYSSDGRQVLNTVAEGNGSVSTAGLSQGVYIYKFGEKSGKILVK